MQTQKVIESLGYSAKEAKVYLVALSLGESHVSDLAKKVRLPRSSTQVVVDRLHSDGLMSFYVRKRYKYWSAQKPEQLLARMKQREENVRIALPQLEALRATSDKPHIEVLEGVEEIRRIYDDILETKRHSVCVNPWDGWVRLLGRGFMEDYIEKRKQRSIRMKLLTPRTALAEELKAKDKEQLRETRFLPDDFNIPTGLFAYGDKIAVVALDKQIPTAVIIEDADVRETMLMFFDLLWQKSTA